MIDGPRVVLTTTAAQKWEIVASPRYDERTLIDIQKLISHFSEVHPLRIVIEDSPLQHVGLGSKTALLLATIASISKELSLNLTVQEMQSISGRGGTSGIGIHGFFAGGFLADSGHPQATVERFLPSAAGRPQRLPGVNASIDIPPNWQFHLLLPPGDVRAGLSEIDFFRRNTPIPKEEVYESIAILYQDLLPGVREGDLGQVSRALHRVHEIGFKSRELAEQGEAVRKSFAFLTSTIAAPVGLSSMGPLLYVIGDTNDILLESSIAAAISATVDSCGFRANPASDSERKAASHSEAKAATHSEVKAATY